MRNPLSKKIVEIQPSGIRKFFDVANEMKDAISLGVGEPDFDTPWRIREEGIFSLEKGRTFYTSNAGLKELREEICSYLEYLGIAIDELKNREEGEAVRISDASSKVNVLVIKTNEELEIAREAATVAKGLKKRPEKVGKGS